MSHVSRFLFLVAMLAACADHINNYYTAPSDAGATEPSDAGAESLDTVATAADRVQLSLWLVTTTTLRSRIPVGDGFGQVSTAANAAYSGAIAAAAAVNDDAAATVGAVDEALSVLALETTVFVAAIDTTVPSAPEATTEVSVSGNLDIGQVVNPSTNIAHSTTVQVYDNLGGTHDLTIDFGEVLPGANGAGTPPETMWYRALRIREVTPVFGSMALPPAGGISTGQIYAEFNAAGAFQRLVRTLTLDAGRAITAVGASVPDTNVTLVVAGTDDIVLPVVVASPPIAMFAGMTQYNAATTISATANGSAGN